MENRPCPLLCSQFHHLLFHAKIAHKRHHNKRSDQKIRTEILGYEIKLTTLKTIDIVIYSVYTYTIILIVVVAIETFRPFFPPDFNTCMLIQVIYRVFRTEPYNYSTRVNCHLTLLIIKHAEYTRVYGYTSKNLDDYALTVDLSSDITHCGKSWFGTFNTPKTKLKSFLHHGANHGFLPVMITEQHCLHFNNTDLFS